MDSASLAPLPRTFTYSEARKHGMPRRAIESMTAQGTLERLGRGLYRRTNGSLIDLDLAAAATRSPAATLCLTSALAHHDLTDQIPAAYDLALPRGSRTPALRGPFSWHLFAADTFLLGREELEVDEGLSIGIYSAERSIIDALRMRRLEGNELGNDALRRWLRRRGSQPASLLELASQFPRTVRPLRQALEFLL